MASAIELDRLTVIRHRSTILDAISATIPRGAVTGLLGPSGSGKTTLMRAIVGAQRITTGSAAVLGLPSGAADLRRRIGYVTQSASVYDDLTVAENMDYFAALYPQQRARRARAVTDAASAVALGGLTDRRVSTLSGGQRSRVSIACALVASPELLVLDEPTVGLDPLLRAELWQRFAEMAAAGTTLLVSSHVLDEAAHCARLLLLRQGHLIAELSPDELLARTGTTTLDEAFLTLVTQEERSR